MTTQCDQMASKLASSSPSSSFKYQHAFLYALIFSLFLVLLVSSFRLNVINSNFVNFVVVRRQQQQQPVKNHNDNAVNVIKAVFKKLGRRKMKVGLVNVDHDHTQLMHGLEGIDPVPVRFDRVAADRKWEDFFPDWIDEDERWGRPKCPEIPMPKFEDYKGIDVILAKVPCGTNIGSGKKEGVRDVFRLQVNLVVANMAARIGWMDPDYGAPHRTVYVVFIGSCGPMVEIFRCDDLVMRQGNYRVYKPEIGRLKQKVLMPFGSCELASGYARAGKEAWRPKYKYRPRHAYVTVLHSSEAYVCGAIALAQSIIQTNSTKDLVLLADDSITPTSIAGLQAAGWDVRRIQRIRSVFSEKGSYNEWNYSKLRVWQLTEYSKVIFIDADLLVLENMDIFFTYPQLSAAANHKHLFNSGLMVLEPSQCMFEYLMRKIFKIEPYNGGDQGFLNEIFTRWHRLPWWLNALKTFEGKSIEKHVMANDLYAVHYLGLKPWMCYRDYDCNWDVDSHQVFASDSAHRRWWQIYDAMPKELQPYCGLTQKMEKSLKTWRDRAANNAGFVDGHWKIEIKDPRQHH
ncbi:putative UDP-glucuronate:xylan alpha-glucuronosyltransferase 5 [Rosa rugosa]|uniref:putative UDP-glucuronate:xylan alpha-glucuronosyltransferase 5 n=1 Tax=Rosa rugosa TaxID=74645 RepID=UPI002B405BED|nr:putative UDP-glucuronate:xylan alpha-glucuronosyltransferase 5 [Rosa rugosa]